MDVKYIRECFNYNPETGIVTWRVRPENHFASNGAAKAINSRYAGTIAGTKRNDGRLQVSLNKESHYLSRLIWIYMTGQQPDGVIDHINHNTSDNRWKNLRDVSHRENLRNQPTHKNNSSGAVGVYKHKVSKKWAACISSNKKRIHLGVFSSFEDACAARKAAEKCLGYHENHGATP